MERRDFLLWLTPSRREAVEVSCERLYMHYVELCASGIESPAESHLPDELDGEPPAMLNQPTPDEFFTRIAEQLKGTRWLRLADTQWLTCDGFRAQVQRICTTVEESGGRVECLPTTPAR